jgi:hypothetical protein
MKMSDVKMIHRPDDASWLINGGDAFPSNDIFVLPKSVEKYNVSFDGDIARRASTAGRLNSPLVESFIFSELPKAYEYKIAVDDDWFSSNESTQSQIIIYYEITNH